MTFRTIIALHWLSKEALWASNSPQYFENQAAMPIKQIPWAVAKALITRGFAFSEWVDDEMFIHITPSGEKQLEELRNSGQLAAAIHEMTESWD